MELYSIKDTVVGTFGAPCACPNVDVAKRMVGYSYANQPFYRDCQLYHVGFFNEDTGIILCGSSEFICDVADCVREYQESIREVNDNASA